MPTYQYACTECGHSMDVVQAFSDDALTECPACQGRLRKLFGNVGVVFKGSGFYRNDSRSEGSGKTDTAATGDAPAKADKPSSDGGSEAPSTTAKPSKPAAPAPAPAASSTPSS